ncbi:MAG: hypothetical protein DRI86_06205 [Bacteroidetes bacterium]|nr:MAG: hypothetical protein DRI86_06205 [Bacteroidota bacterium]
MLLLSTAYFPPISYISQIAKAESVLIEAHENFQKQSYRNRCYIAGPNNKQILSITVVRKNGNHTPIDKITFSDQYDWKKNHWNSIITAYNSSSFLLYYKDEIKECFFENYNSLLEMNTALLKLVLELMQINTPIEFTKSFELGYANTVDFRDTIHPKKSSLIKDIQKPYFQVFEDRYGFLYDLSVLDLLFNMGPEAVGYL